MKTKDKIGCYIIRSGVWAVFLSIAFIALSSAFNSPNGWHKTAVATGVYDTTPKTVYGAPTGKPPRLDVVP